MKQKTKTAMKGLLLVLLLFAALLLPGFYDGLKIQHYKIDTGVIKNPVRIALIADLHSCQYGENEQELIRAIDAQQPDLLVLAGDIFDDGLSDDNAVALIRGVAGRYPCYYVTGNHEYWSGSRAFSEKMAVLETYGVKRLAGEMETVTVNGETMNICGVDDQDANLIAGDTNRNAAPSQEQLVLEGRLAFEQQLASVKKCSQNGHYTVLIAHRPELFDLYVKHGFDLVLCGHAHGGQWRIPGILNGVFAPNQGFFPKYAGGKYQSGKTTMIVSRGLARETTRVPRFYNRPELVVIDCE